MKKRNEKTPGVNPSQKVACHLFKKMSFLQKGSQERNQREKKSFEALTQKSENANSNICDWRDKNILTTAIVLELLTDF